MPKSSANAGSSVTGSLQTFHSLVVVHRYCRKREFKKTSDQVQFSQAGKIISCGVNDVIQQSCQRTLHDTTSGNSGGAFSGTKWWIRAAWKPNVLHPSGLNYKCLLILSLIFHTRIPLFCWEKLLWWIHSVLWCTVQSFKREGKPVIWLDLIGSWIPGPLQFSLYSSESAIMLNAAK